MSWRTMRWPSCSTTTGAGRFGNAIIADLDGRGAKVVISQHPRRASPRPIDEEMYKWRHLIENFFCKLKEFKRIAMRADKTDQSFTAMIHIAAAVIASR
jgi:transposase